jgi:MYXO-CTERM domain-containing protein
MRRGLRTSSSALLLALGLALLAGASRPAAAASINYGNFGPLPPGISFLAVTESSATDPVPLFGPPEPFPVGLDFDPIGFTAYAAGGAVDATDGQLNFSVLSSGEFGIDGISLFEGGDYTLLGAGSAATQALAGATLRVLVTQINGVNVAPINLAPVLASVGFNLIANAGIVNPWSLGVFVDIAGQLDPGLRATRVDVVIDNQLVALSERASLAFIAKKDFRIKIDTSRIPQTSEPGGLVLGGLLLLAARRRRTV